MQIGAIPLYFSSFKLTSIFFCLTRNMIEVYVCLVESHSFLQRPKPLLPSEVYRSFSFLSTNICTSYYWLPTPGLRKRCKNFNPEQNQRKTKTTQKFDSRFFPGVKYLCTFLMRIFKASIIAKTFMLNLI